MQGLKRICAQICACLALTLLASCGASPGPSAHLPAAHPPSATSTNQKTPIDAASWQFAGNTLSGSRSQPGSAISPQNVGALRPKWIVNLHGTPSATPTVLGGTIYIPDWGGYLSALNAATGRVIWSRRISSYDLVPNAVARTSPAVYGGELILGDQSGAHVFAVNRRTGALIWVRQVDPHPAAVITGSPVVYRGTVYVGVSSLEESLASNPSYRCCTFRGSVVALSAATGRQIFKTYTVPPNGGAPGLYSGGAVWDTPAVDPALGLLFVGTGNNYSVPKSATACFTRTHALRTSDAACTPPSDHFDSVMALRLSTGAIVWAHKVQGFDAWTWACQSQPPGVTWCPSPEGPDYDFGSSPNLFTVASAHGALTAVGIGQKSGVYWAFDAATGRLLWSRLAGPGSSLGGIEWGTASDGSRIYVAVANWDRKPYILPSGRRIFGGSVAALDPATGRILWQTGDPLGAADLGAVSVARGVVYFGSMDPGGHVYALGAQHGKILWSYRTGATVQSGAAIVGDAMYIGSGYGHFSIGVPSTRFYAFTPRGR